jgi:hypothetical protein
VLWNTTLAPPIARGLFFLRRQKGGAAKNMLPSERVVRARRRCCSYRADRDSAGSAAVVPVFGPRICG